MSKLKESQKMIDSAFDMVNKLKADNLVGDYEESENTICIRYSLAVNKFLFLYLTNYARRVHIMPDHNNMPDTIFIRKEIYEAGNSYFKKTKKVQ